MSRVELDRPLFAAPKFVRREGCDCRICNGTFDPEQSPRLTVGVAMEIDGMIVSVAAGKLAAGLRDIEHLGPGGASKIHILVCDSSLIEQVKAAMAALG